MHLHQTGPPLRTGFCAWKSHENVCHCLHLAKLDVVAAFLVQLGMQPSWRGTLLRCERSTNSPLNCRCPVDSLRVQVLFILSYYHSGSPCLHNLISLNHFCGRCKSPRVVPSPVLPLKRSNKLAVWESSSTQVTAAISKGRRILAILK